MKSRLFSLLVALVMLTGLVGSWGVQPLSAQTTPAVGVERPIVLSFQGERMYVLACGYSSAEELPTFAGLIFDDDSAISVTLNWQYLQCQSDYPGGGPGPSGWLAYVAVERLVEVTGFSGFVLGTDLTASRLGWVPSETGWIKFPAIWVESFDDVSGELTLRMDLLNEQGTMFSDLDGGRLHVRLSNGSELVVPNKWVQVGYGEYQWQQAVGPNVRELWIETEVLVHWTGLEPTWRPTGRGLIRVARIFVPLVFR